MRQRRIKDLDDKLAVYSGGIRVNPRALKGRWQGLFEKEQPLYMELGCGKGRFIRSLAAAYPDRNFIAVEGNGSVLLRALQRTVRRQMAGEEVDDISDRDLAQDFFGNEGQRPAVEAVLTPGVFAIDLDRAGLREGADDYEKSLWRTAEADCLFAAAPNLVYAYTYIRSVPEVFDKDELDGLYLNFSDPWPKERQAARRLTHRRYLEGYRQVLKPGACLEFKTDNEKLFRFSVEEFEACGLERLEYTEDLHGAGTAAQYTGNWSGESSSASSARYTGDLRGAGTAAQYTGNWSGESASTSSARYTGDSHGADTAAQYTGDPHGAVPTAANNGGAAGEAAIAAFSNPAADAPDTPEAPTDAPKYESADFMTEYEEKFSAAGHPIYYCKVRF